MNIPDWYEIIDYLLELIESEKLNDSNSGEEISHPLPDAA